MLIELSKNTKTLRVFTCLILSPAGRPLRTFKTLLELLQVLREAVKGHRSLFQQAKIVHQDVSAENIIITDAQSKGDPKGIMIDLDVAMNLVIGTRTKGEVTGTRPFMTIGILRKRPHTYRHDLESFLHVFLWTIYQTHPRTLRGQASSYNGPGEPGQNQQHRRPLIWTRTTLGAS